MTVAASSKQSKDETAVLAKIGTWAPEHRDVGERLHRTILAAEPGLKAKLWYGMPGYGLGGPVLVFFRVDDGLFSFGLTEKVPFAPGEDDQLMPSAWYFKELDEATERRIAQIVTDALAGSA